MTITEARICNKKKYAVCVNDKLDTFGYWRPNKDTIFIISALREFFNSELNQFSAIAEITIPGTATVYTASLDKIIIAPEFELLLESDLMELKRNKLKNSINDLLAEGATADEIYSIFEKVINKE